LRPHAESRWDEVAILLLNRAGVDDSVALDGLLERASKLSGNPIERELATYLVDLYRRSPQRTLERLSLLELRERREVARLIVEASLSLYHGDPEGTAAPWPSRRLPESLITTAAERGWEAVLAAEREHQGAAGEQEVDLEASSKAPSESGRERRHRS
jgi:hypothetical protein